MGFMFKKNAFFYFIRLVIAGAFDRNVVVFVPKIRFPFGKMLIPC